MHSLMVKAGLGDFSRDLFLLFGLLSLALASLFILGQKDYKRLLARALERGWERLKVIP